jgi:hypothetical protein
MWDGFVKDVKTVFFFDNDDDDEKTNDQDRNG